MVTTNSAKLPRFFPFLSRYTNFCKLTDQNTQDYKKNLPEATTHPSASPLDDRASVTSAKNDLVFDLPTLPSSPFSGTKRPRTLSSPQDRQASDQFSVTSEIDFGPTTQLRPMAPDLTILVNQLQLRISSMEETINKHMAEKTAWMAQQSKLMDLILSLNETIKSLQVPVTQKPVNTKKVTTTAASGEGSSSADSMHAPTQPFIKVSYAAKAAKAVKAENKKLKPKQTKARPPTIDTTKRILSEPTGPSQYKFVYLPCRHHLRHSAVRKLL
ncbi:hypothetical protein DFQ30_007686, partial [Apophysomyces sp. BC1015]